MSFIEFDNFSVKLSAERGSYHLEQHFFGSLKFYLVLADLLRAGPTGSPPKNAPLAISKCIIHNEKGKEWCLHNLVAPVLNIDNAKMNHVS